MRWTRLQVSGLPRRPSSVTARGRRSRQQQQHVELLEPICRAYPLRIHPSARIQPAVDWQAGGAPQLSMLAGAPLPAGLGFKLQQEDGQPPPAAAYAAVSASLLSRQPPLQLLCAPQEDGWAVLQLPSEQRLTRAGVYELELVYREPRPELAELLAQGGQMQLARVQQVGRPGSCSGCGAHAIMARCAQWSLEAAARDAAAC